VEVEQHNLLHKVINTSNENELSCSNVNE